jgi:hypothetical protein
MLIPALGGRWTVLRKCPLLRLWATIVLWRIYCEGVFLEAQSVVPMKVQYRGIAKQTAKALSISAVSAESKNGLKLLRTVF